jgi:hypothetical protein
MTTLTASYVEWWDPKNIENKIPIPRSSRQIIKDNEGVFNILQEEMWQEYYRPFTISSTQKIFSYGMNSTLRNFHPKYLLSKFDLWQA